MRRKCVILNDSSGNKILLDVLGVEAIFNDYVQWGKSVAGKMVANDNPYRQYIPDIKLVK